MITSPAFNLVIKYAKRIFTDFILTLYPENCLHCSDILVANEAHLCTQCKLNLPFTNYHKISDNPLFRKFLYNRLVINAFAYLYYNKAGVAQKLVHELKYRGNMAVGYHFGRLYADQLQELKDELNWDVIVPIPIHWKKKKTRGYNQSELIAQGIGEVLKLHVEQYATAKIEATVSQTKKTKIERLRNVSYTFQILRPLAVRGKNILLVDDVVTTGATAGELCEELAKCGVKSITVCALATAGEK